ISRSQDRRIRKAKVRTPSNFTYLPSLLTLLRNASDAEGLLASLLADGDDTSTPTVKRKTAGGTDTERYTLHSEVFRLLTRLDFSLVAPSTPSPKKMKLDLRTVQPVTPSPTKFKGERPDKKDMVDTPMIRAMGSLAATDSSPSVVTRSGRATIPTERAVAIKTENLASSKKARKFGNKPAIVENTIDSVVSASDPAPSSTPAVSAPAADVKLFLDDEADESDTGIQPLKYFMLLACTSSLLTTDFRRLSKTRPPVPSDDAVVILEDDAASLASGDEPGYDTDAFIVSDSADLTVEEDGGILSSGDSEANGPAAGDAADLYVIHSFVHFIATMLMQYGRSQDDGPDGDANEVVVSHSVMQPRLQDPLLKTSYEDLYLITRILLITPSGVDRKGSNNDVCSVEIRDVIAKMDKENARSLLKGLLFVQHGFYVNLCRLDLDLLRSYEGRIAIKSQGAFCHCITVGVVTKCFLNGEGMNSSSNKEYPILQRRLYIAQFEQEALREMSAIHHVLRQKSSMKGTYSSIRGLGFVTRKKDKGAIFVTSAYSGGYGLPAPVSTPRKSGLFKYKPAPPGSTSKAAPSSQYSTWVNSALNYNERVPIFDGRAETAVSGVSRPFRFTPQDFDELPTWREFQMKNRTSELARNTVVAVGYTVGSFTYREEMYAATNIKFVIVLDVPKEEIGLGDEDEDDD
ncbi:hypothetical protein H0H93_005201, partial [Arthromyces matolae]